MRKLTAQNARHFAAMMFLTGLCALFRMMLRTKNFCKRSQRKAEDTAVVIPVFTLKFNMSAYYECI